MQRATLLPAQFFAATEAAFAHALAACGRATTSYFCVAGAVVCLNFAGTALVEPLTRAMGHLVTEPVAMPDLTIGLWDVASTGTLLPPPPWSDDAYGAKSEITGFGDDVILTAFQVDTRSLLLYHRGRALAFYVTLDAAGIPYYEAGAPLRTIWHWWARDANRQLLHAGAVGTQTGGVLLVGRSGAGKSNTALACLQSELGYASDDYCLIQLDPTPIVYSIFSSAKTQHRDLARLPFLTPASSNSTGAEKTVYFINEHFPEKIIRSFPLRAILIPRVTGKRDTTVVPASPAEALLAAAPSTRAQLPYAGSQVVVRIAQLVRRVPALYLDVGTDVGQIPRAIQNVLENMPPLS